MPSGYSPQDELWWQDTVVLDAVVDAPPPEPVEPKPAAAAPKTAKTSRYLIIGLTATIVVLLVALAAVVLTGNASWSATPGATTAAPTKAAPITPLGGAAPTDSATNPRAQPTTVDNAPATTAPQTTTTTVAPTTTTTVPALHDPCDTLSLGQTAKSAKGITLTCDIAGGASPAWLDENAPTAGSTCDASSSGYFGTTADGRQLLCARGIDATGSRTYTWQIPGQMSGGTHESGQPCNTQRDIVAKSSSGRAVLCQPSATSPHSTTGTWQSVPS